MANSVFHNIYTQHYDKASSNVLEENCAVVTTFRLLCLETVLNMFVWKNLPVDVLPYMPERYACWWGMFAAFKDDDNELKIFPAYPAGELLQNGQYSRYNIIAMNGKNWIRNREDVALCYNNTLATPSIGLVNELADKMSTALRAVDCALERSLIPTVFSTSDPEDFKTLSGLYDKTKNQLPFRVMASNNGLSEVKVINDAFDTSRYNVTMLYDVFTKYRNLFNQIFGINALSVIKKERLTSGELTGGEEQASFTLINGMYERRKEFCKECKEKFNSDIDFDVSRGEVEIYHIAGNDVTQLEMLQNTITEKQEDNNEQGTI